MNRRTLVQAAIGALTTVLVFIALGLTINIEGHDVSLSQQPAAGESPTAAPSAEGWKKHEGKKKIELEELRCFRCHNFQKYRNGEDFAHADHDDVGHCHKCHAFEGHFQATIRKEACEGCH